MPRKLLSPVCAVAAGLVTAVTPTWAETDADAQGLARITIVGSKENIDEIPGSAHTITEEELEQHGYFDIHRVLRQIPGINIAEEEGFGLFPNIGLRGTRLERNSRVTMMEDNVLIAPAPYAAPAAYYFPNVGRINTVEVRKGSAAIQSGPYTTGGAINFLSTPVPEDFAGKAELQFGRFGGRRAHAWVGGSNERFGAMVEGFHSSSDGFKKLDRVGDDVSPSPNTPVPDTGFEIDNFLGKLRFSSAAGSMPQELEIKLARDDKTANETYLGLTAADFQADPFRRYRGSQFDQINTEHSQAQVRHYIAPAAGFDVTTTAYYNEFSRNWYKLHNVQNEAGGGFVGTSAILADPEAFASAFDWITGQGGDLLGNVRANNREYYSQGIQTRLGMMFDTGAVDHELEVGVRYHEDEEDRLQWDDSFRMVDGSMVLVRPGQEQGMESGARSGVPGSATNRVTNAEAWALFVQDTIRIGGFTLTPGLRYEDISYTRKDFFEGDDPHRDEERRRLEGDTSVFLPGIGATWTIAPGWTALAGVHRGFAPTGPTSDEETSWNYEAGFRYRNGAMSGSAVGFFTRYDNFVGVCTEASGGGCEVGDEFEGGRVDVRGVELQGAWDIGQRANLNVGLPLTVAYTWTEGEFKSSFASGFAEWGEVTSGDELPQIPEHQLNIGFGVLWRELSAFLNANYTAKTRAVAGSGPITDDETIDGRWLFDIAADYRVHENVRLFGSVENLTDETYLAARRPAGVRPGMPRTGWLGVKFDF